VAIPLAAVARTRCGLPAKCFSNALNAA
jgi:hypothetical protein